MNSPSLPDLIIALMRANEGLKQEAEALREADNDSWVNFYMAADEQIDAAVEAIRHAHGNLIRLHRMAIKVKKQVCRS